MQGTIVRSARSSRWLTFAVFASLGACEPAGDAQGLPWPTDVWATSSPDAQGLAGEPFASLDRGIRQGTYGYVDRMVVVRNGYLVVNERCDNEYREITRNRTHALGCGIDACQDSSEIHQFNYIHPDYHPYYQGREVHSLQSATKSVAATVMGVALGRGAISSLDTPLLGFFEGYDLSSIDPRLHAATLDDLLAMLTGIEWHDDNRPIEESTTWELENSDDWIQFTLNQPMDAAPGEKWVYNSGGSHLMSGVIKSATGEFIDAYAEEHLFGPLGIDDYYWKKTPRGYPDTEGGLYLETEDLARIGYLYLRDGKWDGERILPERWVELGLGPRRPDRLDGFLAATHSVSFSSQHRSSGSSQGGASLDRLQKSPDVLLAQQEAAQLLVLEH
jgi:CubicO group peptidase (beta-lactamase class C family)